MQDVVVGSALACLATVALWSGAAFADPAQSSSAQTAPFQMVNAPANDPNQLVCHTMGPPTGSRIGNSRECHTAKEWEMRRLEHQRAVNSQQLHALLSNEPGG